MMGRNIPLNLGVRVVCLVQIEDADLIQMVVFWPYMLTAAWAWVPNSQQGEHQRQGFQCLQHCCRKKHRVRLAILKSHSFPAHPLHFIGKYHSTFRTLLESCYLSLHFINGEHGCVLICIRSVVPKLHPESWEPQKSLQGRGKGSNTIHLTIQKRAF